jgi:hypothetical protein
LTEITLKLKRGELIDKGANDKLRFREGRAVRDRFQALPPRIAAEVHGCEDVASTERLLMREIKSVLEGCADELS